MIVTRGTPAVQAAKNATATDSRWAMAASGDPLWDRRHCRARAPGRQCHRPQRVHSLFPGKRLELLKEAVPGIARLAFLSNFGNPVARTQWEEMSLAASKLRFEPILIDVRKPEDMERAFEMAVAQRADALVVGNDTVTHTNRRLVVSLRPRHRLPAIYPFQLFRYRGGLITYSLIYPPPLPAGSRPSSITFSRARSRPTCRSSSRPSTSW